MAATRGGNWVGGSFRLWLVDWAASVVVWRTYGMGKSAFQTGLKLHPLVSPTILSANMWDMFHFFLVFTYTKDFYGLYHDALWVVTSFFVLYYSSVAKMIELSIRELLHSSIFWAGPWDLQFCLFQGLFFTCLPAGFEPGAWVIVSSVENGQKKSRSDPFRFLLCSVRFRICGIPFSYLRKWERVFSVRFRRITFSSGIDPYLFRFLSRFQSMWDMSRNWYVHKPTNHQSYMLTC